MSKDQRFNPPTFTFRSFTRSANSSKAARYCFQSPPARPQPIWYGKATLSNSGNCAICFKVALNHFKRCFSSSNTPSLGVMPLYSAGPCPRLGFPGQNWAKTLMTPRLLIFFRAGAAHHCNGTGAIAFLCASSFPGPKPIGLGSRNFIH